MVFKSNKQRKFVMNKLSVNQKQTLDSLLLLPQTTIRTIKVKGQQFLERRIQIGNKIILERVKLNDKK